MTTIENENIVTTNKDVSLDRLWRWINGPEPVSFDQALSELVNQPLSAESIYKPLCTLAVFSQWKSPKQSAIFFHWKRRMTDVAAYIGTCIERCFGRQSIFKYVEEIGTPHHFFSFTFGPTIQHAGRIELYCSTDNNLRSIYRGISPAEIYFSTDPKQNQELWSDLIVPLCESSTIPIISAEIDQNNTNFTISYFLKPYVDNATKIKNDGE